MQETYKMKQQIQDHLDKVILPFWESLKDDEYGGFYGYSVPREEKGLLYPSRCSVSSTSNASTSFTSGFFCMKLFSVYWFANSRIGRSKWS